MAKKPQDKESEEPTKLTTDEVMERLFDEAVCDEMKRVANPDEPPVSE